PCNPHVLHHCHGYLDITKTIAPLSLPDSTQAADPGHQVRDATGGWDCQPGWMVFQTGTARIVIALQTVATDVRVASRADHNPSSKDFPIPAPAARFSIAEATWAHQGE